MVIVYHVTLLLMMMMMMIMIIIQITKINKNILTIITINCY